MGEKIYIPELKATFRHFTEEYEGVDDKKKVFYVPPHSDLHKNFERSSKRKKMGKSIINWMNEVYGTTSRHFICFWCGKRKLLKYFTKDHLIPIARGGHNKWENLVPSCKDCNRDKGALFPKDFMATPKMKNGIDKEVRNGIMIELACRRLL